MAQGSRSAAQAAYNAQVSAQAAAAGMTVPQYLAYMQQQMASLPAPCPAWGCGGMPPSTPLPASAQAALMARLQAQNPALYQQVLNEQATSGITCPAGQVIGASLSGALICVAPGTMS